MTGQELYDRLSAPFSPEEVEWKLQNTSGSWNGKALAVPYIKSAAIQKRLDETAGPYGWQTDFRPWLPSAPSGQQSQLCVLSLYSDERKEWIHKTDGAEMTDYESIKGGLSSAFKRAAQLWGIGRYLKELPSAYCAVETYQDKKGNEKARIGAKGFEELNAFYRKWVTGVRQPPGRSPADGDTFQYIVQAVSTESFGQSLILRDSRNRTITAVREGCDQALAEGVRLKEAYLAEYPGRKDLQILRRYKIAA